MTLLLRPALFIITAALTSAAAVEESPPPQREEQYKILSSPDLLNRLLYLSKTYPNFCTLTTTQEWFGLPRAGEDGDCPFDELYAASQKSAQGDDEKTSAASGKGCNNYVLIIQDKEAYPNDPDVQLDVNFQTSQQQQQQEGWKFVPDVFLSGSVHGNERVGPTSLVEMSELLLESAACESLPRMKFQPSDSNDDASGQDTTNDAVKFTQEQWEQELSTAQTCRQSLTTNKGIPSPLRQWLARLVTTRRTIIIPTANALGYSRNKREEGSIDPNRDFPFDIEQYHESECMQTIAGRSINELWRSHLFQIGLTFHGGMEVIGYEWGAPTYLNLDAPDALAQDQIAHAYSRYSNGFPGHVPYDFGTMNDKVYYVRGGMEDWAFAGSWDPDRVVQCTPTTYGGYPPEKTVYNNSTLRAFNMLIETSDKKEPLREDLGSRHDPLISTNGRENGHVARNIRLALLAMDVVEPYVSIRGVEELMFEDDVIPAMNLKRSPTSYYDDAKLVWVHGGDKKSSMRKITWTVGGAMTIDGTEIVYGLWDDLPTQLAESTSGFYPSMETRNVIDTKFQVVQPSNVEGGTSGGRSRWHADGAYPAEPEGGDTYEQIYNYDPVFKAFIDTGKMPPGTAIAVFVRAKVDKDWATSAANVGPAGLGPASHIVNARTNPSYFASNAGKVIHGREYSWWYSDPITVLVGDSKEAEGWDINDPTASGLTHFSLSSNARGVVTAVHVNARFAGKAGLTETFTRPLPRSRGGDTTPRRSSSASAALVVMLLIAIGIFVRLVRPRRRRRAYRQTVAVSTDVEGGDDFDASYRDDVGNEGIGDLELRIS
ncbi:M14 family carboxypeptidase [Skeletonema marinoi]|uniref:M14 family carboxypeptidase n=1 Tax=Skeletonema marinoi TaxID=267567 RepID=A0AAD9D9A4_9STRA|nr:M14 family carboxypeptidase [Skeletonema marinoi]